MEEQNKKVTIHNKISNTYREIHVDGAFGGITPRGLINLSFYAERTPIPKSSEFKITDKRIGELIKNSSDSKTGILREFEFGIYTDINVAKSLIKLLTEKINDFEKFNLNNKL
jgi:hypothetical protein